MLQIGGWVGGWGEIVLPMPEALSFAESRRQKSGLSGHVTLKQAPRIEGSSEDIKSRSSCYPNSHNDRVATRIHITRSSELSLRSVAKNHTHFEKTQMGGQTELPD
jgi:hypothetical protein